MICICKDCLHIGLGHYDRKNVRRYAPIVANSVLLLAFTTVQDSIQVMFSVMKIIDVSTDKLITALSFEDSCSNCYGSRSMIPVFSEEGEKLVMENYSHLLREKITITVSEPN